MNTILRLRLEMGASAATFCKAHPDTNPDTAKVAARLLELVDKADTLMAEQRGGLVSANAAVVDKTRFRVAINADLVALAKISRQASRDNPEITVHLRIPNGRASASDFFTAAKVALADAQALKEVLLTHGLSEELLTSLEQNLDAFKAADDRKRLGVGDRVGAAADLEAVAHDIMGVVASLDAVHSVRFRKQPDLLANWKSARNVAWPVGHVEKEAAPVPQTPVGTTTPAAPAGPVGVVEGSKAA